ncbi:MAG TPA: carboxypeptidase-like regulatory domain-containing protein, partial [Thermoanaerobaculia bacterium]|nr:carboxypeptidase-like regulatory domain-containing protein [Thermoanaerobaculia bacterium]
LQVYGSRVESSYKEALEISADRDVLVELQTVAVSGRVIDSADRSPIHNATVTLLPPGDDDGFPMQTSTDARGSFRLRDVAEGSWKLRAVLPGYAPEETDLQVAASPIDGIELSLQATEGVVLEVFLASGRPPETVNTAVLDPAGRVVASATYPTGEEGRVRIASVAPGTWELLLDATGSAPIALTVTAPGNAGRVVLPRPGGLTLQVPALREAKMGAKTVLVDANGKPFRAPWGYQAQSEFPLTGGARRFDRLPPGNWSVTVKADDGRTWTGQAVVTPGRMAEVTLE